MDAFYLMFPALSSLLRWGSLFPAQSILGAVPDTLTPAASKVVLVLADDANGHKSRVTRQNPPVAQDAPPVPNSGATLLGQIQALGQSLGQGLGQNLGQGVGQNLGQGLGQNLGQDLGQAVSQNLAQTLGQGLGQNLGQGLGQNLGQDLAQGLGQNLAQGLGQNLGQGLGQNLGQSIGQSLGQIVNQLPPPLGQGPLFPQLPGLLGQAPPAAAAPAAPAPPADDPPTDAQAPPPAPPAPAAAEAAPPTVGQAAPSGFNMFDMNNNLLGQALPATMPMPANPFMGLNQFWQGQGLLPQGSEISEVRVKPETITYKHPQHMETKRAQEKIKSTLQMKEQEKEKQRAPLVWFRTPAADAQQEQTEQQGIHAKLLAFERQVISELKMLQQIEGMARDMRATAYGGRPAPHATYRLRYPLSHTPVHKITREDIERTMRDDFVRHLLYKEAQRKVQRPDEHVANIKRQTTGPLSKEDMDKVMAYAYRLAQDASAAANQNQEKDMIYSAYRAAKQPAFSPIPAAPTPLLSSPPQGTMNPAAIPLAGPIQAGQEATITGLQQLNDQTRWEMEKMRAMQRQNEDIASQRAEPENQQMLQQAKRFDLVDATMQQMPADQTMERHKGNLYGVFRSKVSNLPPDAGDSLGLGGNHKKHKSKSATPTIINYYSTPLAPPPPPPQVAPPSYGTSYGGGGYGSNAYAGGVAYRAAIGNDEIDEMLRQHHTLAVS